MNPKIQLALWIAHPVLELFLVGVMLWRRLHRTFPVFFSYVVFQVLNFLVLFPIFRSGNARAYFCAYWMSAAISLAFGFKIIHEIFLDVLRPYPNLKDLGTLMLKWAALVMLLVAMVVMAASQTGAETPLGQAVIIVQRFVRSIQCGLILFLLFFSRHLGVSKRQTSFGIALGFGGFATVELLILALVSGGQIHLPKLTLSLINTAAYGLSILIWIGYASLRTPSPVASAKLVMSRRWDYGLKELRYPVAGDSLIPMFEDMVDRAFSPTPREPDSAEFTPSVQGKTTPEFSPRVLRRN